MATQITNTASATYGYGRTSADSTISNTTSTILNEDYSISANKVALVQNFRNGENITYQIDVVNDGMESLANVTIKDDLGGSNTPLEFVNGSSYVNIEGENNPITPTSTNPLTFVITELLASETATITYVARVSSSLDTSIESISNTASISANKGSSSSEIIYAENNPTATITRESYADLSISKSVSVDAINIGEEFSFILHLENDGNLDANGIVITDTLPEDFNVSGITITENGSTTTIPSSDYEIDPTTNTLTLPTTSSTMSLSVPPSGFVTITISGMIN